MSDPDIGNIVTFRGEQYKVICCGDVPGTFDLHPYPVNYTRDSWRNVPPSELTLVQTSG